METITRETPGIEITLTCNPEEEDYRGNVMASGDDAVDREAERWVADQLNSGNDWAWCWVRVEVKWHGFTGDDTLGGCSYLSEEDFRKPGGYFDDMVNVCLARINEAYARACGASIGLAAALQRTGAA